MASVITENLEEFTSSSPREVNYNLRQLVQAGERISVIFDEGRETFLTILLDVDEDTGLLYFDWGGNDHLVRKFLQSERNFFICSPAGIRNQFMVGKVWEADFDRRRAFATRLPQRFMRLQRREFFRLQLPMTQRQQCAVQSEKFPQQLVLAVVDVGIGGVGLESTNPTLPFSAGEILPGTIIPLGNYGRLNVDLNVRYTTRITRGNKEHARMGCQFVKLPGAQEHDLQRFMTHIQRELKAKAL
jgi:c-di-GMP-binding flagellar brake protein YcgR